MAWGYGEVGRDFREPVSYSGVQLSSDDLDSTSPFPGAATAISGPPYPVVVEGDSWFDIRNNILTHLDTRKWELIGAPFYGDTFENMIFGTDFDQDTYQRKPVQFEATLSYIRRRDPKCFLFSGGGNDVIGQELEVLLNHKSSDSPTIIRTDSLLELMRYFERGFEFVFGEVWNISPNLPIIAHSYGLAQPNGSRNAAGAGPWLKPALVKKGIVDFSEGRDVVSVVVTAFRDLLSSLDMKHQHFHHIDLHDQIAEDEWQDEIHPTTSKFRDIAAILEAKMDEVVVL